MDIITYFLSVVGSVFIDIGSEIGGHILNSSVKTLSRELNIALIESFRNVNMWDYIKDVGRDLVIQPVHVQYTSDMFTTIEKDDINQKIIMHKHMYDAKLYISNPAFFIAGASMTAAVVVFGVNLYYNDAINYIINHMILRPRF